MKSFLAWAKHTFTLNRWSLNPFQMYDIVMLAAVALGQIVLGASPGSIQEGLDRHTLIALAVCNVVGSSWSLFGLHLRDLETGLWIELWGYLALTFVLCTYLWLLFHGQLNAGATYGFGFGEAFVFASIHRAIQIMLYKRAHKKHGQLLQEANVLREALIMGSGEEPQ